ncbi:MAG: hypothetical protein MMC33_009567 [Icmadophila ericetorum]|nr:hypothetical protein [Icmadophila ericetorum]
MGFSAHGPIPTSVTDNDFSSISSSDSHTDLPRTFPFGSRIFHSTSSLIAIHFTVDYCLEPSINFTFGADFIHRSDTFSPPISGASIASKSISLASSPLTQTTWESPRTTAVTSTPPVPVSVTTHSKGELIGLSAALGLVCLGFLTTVLAKRSSEEITSQHRAKGH